MIKETSVFLLPDTSGELSRIRAFQDGAMWEPLTVNFKAASRDNAQLLRRNGPIDLSSFSLGPVLDGYKSRKYTRVVLTPGEGSEKLAIWKKIDNKENKQ